MVYCFTCNGRHWKLVAEYTSKFYLYRFNYMLFAIPIHCVIPFLDMCNILAVCVFKIAQKSSDVIGIPSSK